jgi:uncharacterized protein (TIGR02118 family)
MLAAISLMRKREDITLAAFRRHWLDVHGPLVCGFPALRHYVQDHVIESPVMNEAARAMRIDGFAILLFDNDADRLRAHQSAEMAACNVDSRSFIGAVSRVICQRHAVVPVAADAGRIRLLALLSGNSMDAFVDAARAYPAVCGVIRYDVLQQGPAPNSTIPHLPVATSGIVELLFPSLVDLECAMTGNVFGAAYFVVEQHRLV